MTYQYKDGIDYIAPEVDVSHNYAGDYYGEYTIMHISGVKSGKTKKPTVDETLDKLSKKCQHAVYSDRLYQWNPKKYDELRRKHFSDVSQYWSGSKPELIEAFLSDYLGQPIKLQALAHQENRSSGYPVWIMFYKEI